MIALKDNRLLVPTSSAAYSVPALSLREGYASNLHRPRFDVPGGTAK
jgi:hypothetical protein